MSKILYVPVIKTADAEVRALENLSETVTNKITPLLEFTRSRKSSKTTDGDIHRRVKRLAETFRNRACFFDLTTDPNLANDQIKDLQSNVAGYKNWTDFLLVYKKEFSKFIPTLQVSDENLDSEDEHYTRLRQQVKVLAANFDKILYRLPLGYEFVEKDMQEICMEIPAGRLICLVDAEYIPKDKASVYSANAISIVKQLSRFSPDKIVVAGTSFPKKPTQHRIDDTKGRMVLEEKVFYQNVTKTEKDVIYGDYATIHPFRNDQSGGNGWVPRIDMPTEDELFYFRDKKDKSEASYAGAYERVAEKVVATGDYRAVGKQLKNCWGLEQIDSAADGLPPGLSPSFWISVRMNIHISLVSSR